MDKKPPSKLDPFETPLLAMRREGVSYREMATAMKARHQLRVSYRTIQNWFQTHHPELAGDDDTDTEAATDSASVSITPGALTVGGEAPDSPPAEDLAALRAQLAALAGAHRALQDKNAALEAEIVSLTEQQSSLEAQSPPGLPVPVHYGGSWEGDMPLLPEEPLGLSPAPRGRVLRPTLARGACGALLLLALSPFILGLSFDLSLTRAYASAMRSPHAPFALLEAALAVSGLGLGLRAKTLVPVLLALITYLLMLRNAQIPFFIALLLTLQVGKALVRDR